MAAFHPETFDETTGYLVQYECPECGESWESHWSCACNDECPSCGLSDIEAKSYELDGTHTQEELDAFNGMS